MLIITKIFIVDVTTTNNNTHPINQITDILTQGEVLWGIPSLFQGMWRDTVQHVVPAAISLAQLT